MFLSGIYISSQKKNKGWTFVRFRLISRQVEDGYYQCFQSEVVQYKQLFKSWFGQGFKFWYWKGWKQKVSRALNRWLIRALSYLSTSLRGFMQAPDFQQGIPVSSPWFVPNKEPLMNLGIFSFNVEFSITRLLIKFGRIRVSILNFIRSGSHPHWFPLFRDSHRLA